MPSATHRATDLLTGLRGKDVVLAFVESYGRDAVEDPNSRRPGRRRARRRRSSAARRRIRRPGARFLTSPTAGGGSWLAHATLLSGLWIDNQQRYDDLAASHRLTLTSAFRRANWRTVGVMPGNDSAWPESESLGYDRIYDATGHGLPRPAVQLGHHARPVHPVAVRTHRARHAGTAAGHGRDHPGLEPRALGAHPPTHRLGRHW